LRFKQRRVIEKTLHPKRPTLSGQSAILTVNGLIIHLHARLPQYFNQLQKLNFGATKEF
jgi:hypothetical protein